MGRYDAHVEGGIVQLFRRRRGEPDDHCPGVLYLDLDPVNQREAGWSIED
jgi:hypothetical protein